MIQAVTALVTRSLQMDSRSLTTHLTRLATVTGIYIALSCVIAIATRFGAPGFRFFSSSVYLNSIALTLIGISSFSTTITEEKEEDTLGLMIMAGISPLGLLIGKTGGRLIQVLILMMLQYPFVLLTVTLGGVSSVQIQSAYLGMASYVVMLAGLGLLTSTIAASSRTSGTWMAILIAAYMLVPYLCGELAASTAVNRKSPWISLLLTTISSSSLFMRISDILTSGYGESPWSLQVISNCILGLVCFGLAWCCFGWALRSSSTEAISRGALTRQKKGFGRTFAPGRAWSNPLIWKDFHFVSGGLSMRLTRFVLYSGLLFVCCGLTSLWGMGHQSGAILGMYQIFLLFAISWETAMLTSRCIHDEVRGQTLSTLVMLPTTTFRLFYSKLFGTLLGAYPGYLFFLVTNLIGIESVQDFLIDGPGLLFVSHFLLVPHLSAVYSFWVRWGAVSLGIGTMVGLFSVWVVLADFIAFFGTDELNEIGVFVLILCGLCHIVILFQIRSVATRA